MKRNITILLILAIACAFTLSAAAATDFEKKDFDGKFKMNIIKGCDFEKTESDGIVTYIDLDNSAFVIYAEDPSITADLSDEEIKAFESSLDFTPDGKEGNISVYKNGDLYGAMSSDDGIVVIAGANDRSDAVDMAKSVEFTK